MRKGNMAIGDSGGQQESKSLFTTGLLLQTFIRAVIRLFSAITNFNTFL